MNVRLTNALFGNARTVERTGQIKNTLVIKVHDNGSVTTADDQPLDILPLGNRGDHCVTEVQFSLPTELQDGYEGYFLVDLNDGIYIQKCEISGSSASAWIEDKITFSPNTNLNCLFVAVEENATAGDNITEETEIFVADEFYGAVQENFLTSGWHASIVVGDDVLAGDVNVEESIPSTPEPVEYTPMVWVNGETPLSAGNMNNIMLGIDEAKEDLGNKLDKTSQQGKIYGTDNSGNQTLLNYSDSPVIPDTIVKRNGTQINVPEEPIQNQHAASKKYVDDQIATKETTKYFDKFVGGENIDAQFNNGEVVYCYNGTVSQGGSTPSAIIISLPQTLTGGGAIYLHSLYLKYRDTNNEVQEYSHTFAQGGVADFTAYGQTQNLSGLSWLLNQTNSGASLPTTSSAKPTGSNIVCLKCGAGASATTTRNLTLSTESLPGCTLLEVKVGVCTTSGGIVSMTVQAANDMWYYNSGTSQTESTTYQIQQSKSSDPYTGDEWLFTNEPDGTELGSAVIITYEDVFLTKVDDEIEEIEGSETLYVNKTTNQLYRYDGETLIKVSGTEFGTTEDTAYRGDLGERNYQAIQTNAAAIRTLNSAKPKCRVITIETDDWDNLSYSETLDPVVVGDTDLLIVTPDDASSQEYYDCGITREIIDLDPEGQALVFTAASAPSTALTIQIVYIQCEAF